MAGKGAGQRRAAQRVGHGRCWAEQGRAGQRRPGQRRAQAGRVSAGHCRVERREQGEGWGRAAQRTEQSRGWAGHSSDWAEVGLGRAALWFAEWQSRAVQGQRRGWAGQGNAEGRARAGHGSAEGRAEQGTAGQSRGWAEQGLRRAVASQGSAGARQGLGRAEQGLGRVEQCRVARASAAALTALRYRAGARTATLSALAHRAEAHEQSL